MKTRSWKSRKIGVFPKGFVYGFGQKLVIFLDFYFRENRPEKCVLNQKKVFYDILDDRNAFLDYKNKKLKKFKNWDFSKVVSPWFWWKIGSFFLPFCISKRGQENVFTIFLIEKTPF